MFKDSGFKKAPTYLHVLPTTQKMHWTKEQRLTTTQIYLQTTNRRSSRQQKMKTKDKRLCTKLKQFFQEQARR